MIYIVTNALPILLAAFAGAALLAALWRPRMTRGLAVALFAAAALLAAILAGALILAPVSAGRSTIALGSAFIIWGGFVLPSVATTVRSRGIGWAGALADAGGWLALMLVQAAVMRIVGVVHP